jgi:hypothetical protein
MHDVTKTLIGSIADFNIYTDKNHGFTACVKIIQNEHVFLFGGDELFSSIDCHGDSRFFLHFLDRCMKINKAHTLKDIVGALIRIQVIDSHVLGMSSLVGTDWFFPQLEFEVLK